MPGPVMRFRSGAVSATVWENQRKDGGTYPSVKLSRSYRDKQTQDWKDPSSFSVNDLPVVAILARKAFEALALDHAMGGPGPGGNGLGADRLESSAEAEEAGEPEEAVPAATGRSRRSRG